MKLITTVIWHMVFDEEGAYLYHHMVLKFIVDAESFRNFTNAIPNLYMNLLEADKSVWGYLANLEVLLQF